MIVFSDIALGITVKNPTAISSEILPARLSEIFQGMLQKLQKSPEEFQEGIPKEYQKKSSQEF